MKIKTKYQGDIEISSITFPFFVEYATKYEFDQLNKRNYNYIEQKNNSNTYGFIVESIEKTDWAEPLIRNNRTDYIQFTYSEFLEFKTIYLQKIKSGEFIIDVTKGYTPYLDKYLSKFSKRYSAYNTSWKTRPNENYLFVGTTTQNIHSAPSKTNFKNHLDLVTITTEDFLKYYKDLLDKEEPTSSLQIYTVDLTKDTFVLPEKFIVAKTERVCEYFAERSKNWCYRNPLYDPHRKYFSNVNTKNENIFYSGPSKMLCASFNTTSINFLSTVHEITEAQFIEHVINKTNWGIENPTSKLSLENINDLGGFNIQTVKPSIAQVWPEALYEKVKSQNLTGEKPSIQPIPLQKLSTKFNY